MLIQEIIDSILKRGARQVSVETLTQHNTTAAEVTKLYERRGWNVRQEGQALLFEEKSDRKLLLS